MYQKNTENGYILSVVSGTSNGNISEQEYNEILAAVSRKPVAQPGFDYKLRENLTWELYELPEPEEIDEEISGEELLDMMEGVL